jgi:acetyl esterase/lipase
MGNDVALWHDIAARLLQLFEQAGPAPIGVPMTAETEAGPVRLWAYRGAGAGADAPVYVHFPDTGFLHRAAGRDDAFCGALAEALGCVVLRVAPPVAPAKRFPAAPTEAQAVAWWAMMAGRKQGWTGKRLALGGRCTGANLALGACLELSARMGVKPLGVVALTPVLDMTEAPGGWRTRLAQAAYLPDRTARLAPLASPVRAPVESLAAFAPTLIVVGEDDPRRGEGEDFAAMLRMAGRAVRLVPVLRPDEAALAEAEAFLRARFATPG